MNITRFAIRRPVGMTMIILLFVVLGLYSYFRIGIELLPALNTPYVSITVDYDGASVQEVEEQVIKPLEQSLSSLSHLKRMLAMARAEKALVILEFDFEADSDMALIEATKLVNRARKNLPDDISEPVVTKRDVNALPIMEIAVKAKYPLSDIYGKADQVFKERLQRADGVSDVALGGGRDRELAVKVDKNKLFQYNISLQQIVNRIKGENVMIPAGSVFTDKTETAVRLAARYTSPEEVRRVYVTNTAGAAVPLTQIAEVTEQDSRANRYGRVNGDEAVSLQVYKNSDANIVSTVKGVKSQLDLLQSEYPEYQFIVVTNDARYIDNSLKTTLWTLVEGIITTGLVLLLFLRGWRSTVAVIVAIPASLISTFLFMYIAGFTFNMMSLMGMTLCIGVLVDDSIVVLENIHRHIKLGKAADIAAEDGRNEIGMAAIAITLCDVVVFLPIAFMDGMTGQYFRQFGLTIVFATLFSLFVSFTLTPLMTARLFKDGIVEPVGRIWLFMDRLEQQTISRYEQILCWCLKNGRKVVVAVLALFVLTAALIPAGIIGTEYMPRTDEGSFRVTVELPVGQNIDVTDAVVGQLEEYIRTIPEVTNCLSYIGDSGGNKAKITVQLVDKRERRRSVWQITDDIRSFSRRNLIQATIRVTETESSVAGVSLSGAEDFAPVLIYLLGSNMDELIEASQRVQAILGSIDGIKDVRSNYKEGAPEFKLTVDRDKLRVYHTAVSDIKDAFSAAVDGKKAGILANDRHNNGLDTDIVVRLKDSDRFKIEDFKSISLSGGSSFLGNVATIEEGVGPISITRLNKQRAIIVQANISDRPLKKIVQDMESRFKQEPFPTGVTYRFAGQITNMDSGFGEVFQALTLSLLLVYMLLAVLYESTVTPLIRMFSLPLGLIGSLLFLLLTHNTINLYSLIGILVMDGLVAKNGTLLLDYTLTLMSRGMTAYDAVVEAGKIRLKPITMTTLTMVVGMLPTALSLNEGAETRISMAWVLIGGLLFSTFFSLIIIPIIFLFFERHPVKHWLTLAGAKKYVDSTTEGGRK